MLKLYKFISYVIYPLLPAVLFIRQLRGKEDAVRKVEKLGKASIARPRGKLTWIHCASVGEANSTLSLIKELLNRDKKLHILMTTGTTSSADLMAKKLPKRAMHQFVPLDSPKIVNRFLNHWVPDSVIWTENEIWPNTLLKLKKRNVPAASVNATVSENSFKEWQKHSKTINNILSTFVITLAQTKKKATMLRKLGAKNVKYVGNLKFTTDAPIVDKKKLAELQKAIGKRKVMCYSSTHKGEEDIAINIHKALPKNTLSIILPRHPNRKNEIKSLLEKTDLNYSFRSDGELPEKNTDIYVADTFGEIGTFYAACPLVFMGGSLSPYHDGGHNPIEPAKFGCAILSGNKISSFDAIFEDMKEASIIVRTEKALQNNIVELLRNKIKIDALSKQSLKIAGKDNTIIEDVISELKKAKVV